MQAKGTLQEPDVRGQLRFRRGFLDLLDRRFAIREGVIAFDGSRPPIPQVSLEAAATAEEVQAVVRLRGPATDPKLELTSEPQLPQDEVLARVLFGRSTDRITPVQGIRLAAAVRELQGGSGGVNGVLDAIRNATGLDTLNVESGADRRRVGRQCRQVHQRPGLSPGPARHPAGLGQGPGRGRADAQPFGRHQRHRAVPDRRRSPVALRLLGPARPGPSSAADLPYRLPAEDSTFGTPLDVNLIGLKTLYLKEVRRFFKVWTQTLLAPMITTLVFLAIFALAMHRAETRIGDLTFLQFLAPGLIMMSVVQNAFSNTSSSLVIAKIQGNIVDYLMPPLGPGELLVGIIAGGVTRGLFVGLAVYVCMLPFVALPFLHPLLALYYVLAASLMLSLLGILGGLWSEKFDQVAAVTNFVITPLSFLSGTFYSVEALPEAFRWLAFANPFFYMIDGIRYAFTDHADGSILLGALLLAVVNVGLMVVVARSSSAAATS